MNELWKLEDLGKALAMEVPTLYKYVWMNKYNIKDYMFKVGGSWRIDEEGYEALLAEIKKEGK